APVVEAATDRDRVGGGDAVDRVPEPLVLARDDGLDRRDRQRQPDAALLSTRARRPGLRLAERGRLGRLRERDDARRGGVLSRRGGAPERGAAARVVGDDRGHRGAPSQGARGELRANGTRGGRVWEACGRGVGRKARLRARSLIARATLAAGRCCYHWT